MSRKLSFGACCACLLCFWLILGSPLAFSQHTAQWAAKDYALIYGTVWGPENQPVYGVPINIRKASDKKPKWQLMSDHSGEFAQRVPPGEQDYIIEADIKLPKGQPKPQVKVHIDNDERQDVSLHLTKEELSAR